MSEAYPHAPNPGPDPDPILWCATPIANRVFAHWKSSAAGILISIATVCGVLAQQGITLGHAGTGTVVTLISALATALLGLLSKDS